MPLPPPPTPNIHTFKVNQRVNPPHEKSPYDLSTSNIKSKSTIVTSLEEIPNSFISRSNEMRFDKLKGESFGPSIRDSVSGPYISFGYISSKNIWLYDFDHLTINLLQNLSVIYLDTHHALCAINDALDYYILNMHIYQSIFICQYKTNYKNFPSNIYVNKYIV